MSAGTGITLQINLAPTDLPHAKHILPHQLRQWAGQVDEVLLVVDMHRSRGRFAEGWEERLPGLQMLIENCCTRYSQAHAREVDYSADVAANISDLFFGGQPVPAKDCKGGPFYSYFFGLFAAKHPYIFHMDSDMMYGGGSSYWLAEAVQLLRERTNVLICSPLPGPPTANGDLRSQFLEREFYTSVAFRAQRLSTRHFLIDKNRLFSTIKQLPMIQPSRLLTWRAWAEGNPACELPEVIFSRAMSDHNLIRVEFLGNDPGMWSIHPPFRSQLFYDRLPEIIQKIETGDIPEAQRGCHDVNDSLLDWTSARKPAWERIAKHVRLVRQRF
jgi:hypothetical protein